MPNSTDTNSTAPPRAPRAPRNRKGRGAANTTNNNNTSAAAATETHATGCSAAPSAANAASSSSSSHGAHTLDPSAASFAPPTGPSRRGGGGRSRGGGGASQSTRGRGRGGAARGGGRGHGAAHGDAPHSNGAAAQPDEAPAAAAASSSQPAAPAQGGRRRNKFGGKITDGADREATSGTATPALAAPAPMPIEYADLRSRLVAELSSGAYDCSVCYSVIGVRASIWSCASCHTVLHLKCAHTWAQGSVRKSAEQNAMQEDAAMRARKGTWRCPGCQYAREEVPESYKCWDGQTTDPAGGKGAPPHSCGRPCAKAKCKHGCPAGVCHPGE